MTPINNLSVLPWYTSLEQQNARKWWVYNRIYPLFTPATFILPFQVMRPSRKTYVPGEDLIGVEQAGYYTDDGVFHPASSTNSRTIAINIANAESVYLTNIPRAYTQGSVHAVMCVAFDESDNVLQTYNLLPLSQNKYNGVWVLPTGTKKISVQTHNMFVPEIIGAPARVSKVDEETTGISQFKLYDKNGTLIGDYTAAINEAGLTVKEYADFDVIVFPGSFPVLTALSNGQYYAEMSDGTDTWYSEMFTVVNDIVPYLKLEWWDEEDMEMESGIISYTEPAFKNVLYLPSDIAKPEYQFEDETEDRDGYTFPVLQISKKVYHFTFFAPEYLLDVMRLIRLSDYIRITYNGQVFDRIDSFLITPDWEDNGDIASVDAEFTSMTVAKKVGKGRITSVMLGDFNDDYNDDYNNQN